MPRTFGTCLRWAGLTTPLVVVLLLAGCGSDDPPPDPGLPDELPALWNPCDALDTDLIEEAFGSVTTEEQGTEQAPECRFVPEKASKQPVVTANYLLFGGSLSDAWKQMGQSPDADVTSPDIPTAADSRVVVSVVDKQLYVSGFVQNGDLIQSVDVVAPSPYDEERVVAGVERTLSVLARHAHAAGVDDESDGPDGADGPDGSEEGGE